MIGAIRLLKSLSSSASICGTLMAKREDYFIGGHVDGSD